jgi:hypothetical protein
MEAAIVDLLFVELVSQSTTSPRFGASKFAACAGFPIRGSADVGPDSGAVAAPMRTRRPMSVDG